MIKSDSWKTIKRICSKRNISAVLSPEALSVLYTSWSKLPIEEKSSYPAFKTEFNKNSISIRKVLKSKQPQPKLIPRVVSVVNPIIDLREKYQKLKVEREITRNAPAKLFATSLKKNIQDSFFKTTKQSTLTSVIKKTLFEKEFIQDEPKRQISESEMEKIPYKESLLVTGYTGEIYISGVKAASDLSKIMKNQIKAVISIGTSKQNTNYISVTGGYQILPIVETSHKILDFHTNFMKAFQFLEKNLKEGNVLINCYYGICRSCAIVIGFLMKKYMVRLRSAVNIVKSGRKSCRLSKAAYVVLRSLEDSLFS